MARQPVPFPGNLHIKPTPLQLMTVDGFPGGMNVAVPPWEIDDTQARYIQDAFVSVTPGKLPRRGPVSAVSGPPTFASNTAVGMVQALTPAGGLSIAVLTVDGSGNLKLQILDAAYASVAATLTLGTGFSLAPYPIIDAKPALGFGTWIGASTSDYASPTTQLLALWGGGVSADYTTGTITVTIGTTAVTGAGTQFTNNVSPGMHIIDSNNTWIGTVASIQSNTALTLVAPATRGVAAGAYTSTALRAHLQVITQGTMTVGLGSTSVAGADTFWLDDRLSNGNTWVIHRAKDGANVGTVSSVSSNVAMTLTSGAAIAMSEDLYYAVNFSQNALGFNINGANTGPGFLNCVWQGRQWHANTGASPDQGGSFQDRLWFSDPVSGESVNRATVAGNFIHVTSGQGTNTPIKAIAAAFNSLLVFKERETFQLSGADENSWTYQKLADDGCLSAMAVQPYQGGVIWPGRDGIYYFDGSTATNIVQRNMGIYWQQAVKGFDPKVSRMWGAIVRDHYFLFVENVTPTITPVKGTVTSSVTSATFCIYLPTEALTLHTNLNFRGAINPTTSQGQLAWGVVNDSTPKGYIFDFNVLFDSTGNDTITCDGGAAGPDYYWESKRYSVGNGLLLKNWKYLLFNYLVGGDALKTDTITGLNDIGLTDSITWPTTTFTWQTLGNDYATWSALGNAYTTWNSLGTNIFATKKLTFLRRDRYFGFRVYQASTSVTNANVGAFAVAYKFGRVGRT